MGTSSGSTPRGAYERAAEQRADWGGVDVWFTDERCVPPDHEHSNFGMADKAWLSRARGATVHRMRGELVTIIAHDLRAPVGVIQSLVQLLGFRGAPGNTVNHTMSRSAYYATVVRDVVENVVPGSPDAVIVTGPG